MDKLLDANILIYASQPAYAYLRGLLTDPLCALSDFTRLEVLGFHGLSQAERGWFEAVCRNLYRYPVTEEVLTPAILLRQARRMSAGDAIIAATALLHGLELQTRNLKDFSHIPGLALHNPVG
ncbi:MAG: type II toxin-antitoxin system VapC family toxin [Bacteroidia bacterium]|nr:type II toxin-antitoxin system VapC family toxin [Bacteroidia bacterium]